MLGGAESLRGGSLRADSSSLLHPVTRVHTWHQLRSPTATSTDQRTGVTCRRRLWQACPKRGDPDQGSLLLRRPGLLVASNGVKEEAAHGHERDELSRAGNHGRAR